MASFRSLLSFLSPPLSISYVVSDQEALEMIISAHHYVSDPADAAAAAITAGCNLELSSNRTTDAIYAAIEKAVVMGKIDESLGHMTMWSFSIYPICISVRLLVNKIEPNNDASE